MGKAIESYADYSSKYFKNVTNVQIVDGLDSFYTNFRNRYTRVADAVWLVVNRIAESGPGNNLNKPLSGKSATNNAF